MAVGSEDRGAELGRGQSPRLLPKDEVWARAPAGLPRRQRPGQWAGAGMGRTDSTWSVSASQPPELDAVPCDPHTPRPRLGLDAAGEAPGSSSASGLCWVPEVKVGGEMAKGKLFWAMKPELVPRALVAPQPPACGWSEPCPGLPGPRAFW